MISKTRFTWHNTIKKHKISPLKYFEPESLKDIVAIVKEAEQHEIRVRAVGAGHSFSDVAIASGYLLDLKRLNQILPFPDFIKTSVNRQNLVQAQAGITIQRFNKLMDQKDLCVINMGGIDNQTLAGAVSTGTHGTGLELPALHGMVRSVVMVVEGGNVKRIEPANGITDPQKHNEDGFELIQDDDYFNSVLVNLGCMGIIYAYVMELQPMYWLEEKKVLTKWSEVKLKLVDRSIFDGYRGVMVQINPYENKSGDHTCIVVYHRLLNTKPHRTLNDRFRNIRSSILGSIGISYYFIKLLMNLWPKKIPGMLDSALKSVRDRKYEHKGYKVLYQGVEKMKKYAFDAEFAFDMDAQMVHFTQAIDKIMERAKQLASENHLYQTSPLGVRFVKRASAYITPEFQRDVCYLDAPCLIHTKGADDIINIYQEIMLECGGIPHWGKINNKLNGRPDLIRKFYPRFDKWQTTMKTLNPRGTFDSDLSDRLQLRTL
ncbi:MAG: FAD-binding protein [Candidatus Cyclobacteriaceae bacterium M3_2C_046]